MPLPPWLQITPSDYLHALQSGTQIGNQLAERAMAEEQQKQKAWEFAQNLQLEYQKMQEQEKLRQQQQQGLQLWRQVQDANRKAQLAQQAANEKALTEYRGSLLGESARRQREVERHNQAMEEARDTGKPSEHVIDGRVIRTYPDGSSEQVYPVPQPKDNTQNWVTKLRGLFSGVNAGPMKSVMDATPGFGGAIPSTPTASVVPPTTTEVTRTTKDGRKAIFDANTKKFLRYADDTNMGRDDSTDESE